MEEINNGNKRKLNKYDLSGEYGIGWTSNTDEKFYFDFEDYDKIKNYTWRAHTPTKNYKRLVTDYWVDGKRHNLIFHKLILDGKIIDHKNHNTFDNRKSNLRECTQQQNSYNASLRIDNTSGIIGVSYRKDRGKWTARIHGDGRYLSLGCYDNIDEAIKARLKAELQYYEYDFSPNRDLFEEYGIIGGDVK